ncbi:tilB-like protein [Chlorella sorokiniana]|uniref:TilB-like protein n=1 Tax=Chlorella sorokiniana TaxID=3076 RepID=A0A2P6TI80_CHLSO|nr:tilB-like protein [Chlorella sorokiniana]|eukprot:PRW34002.1 tilB-like protein [Chlorella sorokiniana]
MAPITEALLVRRAEHNDGRLATLQEVALHQQGIERIELLNQLCRRLRILYLQNNLICKIERLNRLKELEVLNLAVNNIQRVQNLQRCESLRCLDLSVNFIDYRAGLLSLRSLQENEHLEELHLLGNPCTRWPGYRPYVVGTLPRLRRLDGEPVLPSERISAAQQLPTLEARLREELLAEGIDPDAAAQVEDDSLLDAEQIPETGYMDETGQLRRPWCPATRILDHREAAAEAAAAEEKRRPAQTLGGDGLGLEAPEPPPRICFPEVKEGEPLYQKNEGKWEFTLQESADGHSLQLDVALGRYLDTSAIQADVQPSYVRLLARGRLLQLALPAEVRPDAAVAQRSKTTGNLLVTMPLAAASAVGTPGGSAPVGVLRPENAAGGKASGRGSKAAVRGAEVPELVPALVSTAAAAGAAAGNDDDDLPPL